ncbi:hypothetical protein GCM10010112_64960 [Actinoplanes lobatus]|uniref:Uncharacterized protein n=1 Tax=Actinoplanes lobatus TaxID=113568 RepID=A0A7W7MJ49_9ACTN|nr:hypothetical protein [Actinoplanes lobatus]MBB4752026.1 hypothetical protein [Actinoplanes lobatus]GGN85033.1 hypothetical protein GCM10010112_64960 [Actinoplanes lobatus]GIE45355.1 hypothetical protein Alo02nite_82530 [Actinoplanes lobatus]
MKFRPGPITIWGAVAGGTLVTAFVLWLGWPAQAAELPAGATDVQVYLIDDELTTPATPGEQDGWFGSFSMPCDFDSWYVESAGAAMCASLDGPKGTVTATREDERIILPAGTQKAITAWAADHGSSQPPTRALLVLDGEPVGVVAVAAAATAVPAS